MKKWFGVLLALTFLSAVVSASPPISGTINIADSFNSLCINVKTAVPIVAFTMLILGGIIYGAGQIMGAETRARANVWATAMLTGGIIGLIIAASAPYLLGFIMGMFGGISSWGSPTSGAWCS